MNRGQITPIKNKLDAGGLHNPVGLKIRKQEGRKSQCKINMKNKKHKRTGVPLKKIKKKTKEAAKTTGKQTRFLGGSKCRQKKKTRNNPEKGKKSKYGSLVQAKLV